MTKVLDKKTCHNQSITSAFFLFCSPSNYLFCQKQLLKDNPLEITLLSYAILQLFFVSLKKKKVSLLELHICTSGFSSQTKPFLFLLARAIPSPNDTFCGPFRGNPWEEESCNHFKTPVPFSQTETSFLN